MSCHVILCKVIPSYLFLPFNDSICNSLSCLGAAIPETSLLTLRVCTLMLQLGTVMLEMLCYVVALKSNYSV